MCDFASAAAAHEIGVRVAGITLDQHATSLDAQHGYIGRLLATSHIVGEGKAGPCGRTITACCVDGCLPVHCIWLIVRPRGHPVRWRIAQRNPAHFCGHNH